MGTRRLLAVVVTAVGAIAGCSSDRSGDATTGAGYSGSCALVIEVAGSHYIAGRLSDSVLPLTGHRINARLRECDDSGGRTTGATPIVATEIRGIPVADAVAAQNHQLMLSERLWRVTWKDLPNGLQPYVARDGR